MKQFLRGKHITVAGASGFIGTNLVERLVEEGALVRALIHKKNPQILNPKVEYMKVDLTEQEDCWKSAQDTEIFVMAAANSSGAGVMNKDPLVHLTSNVVMNTLTLEACSKSKVNKYCFISSNTVYPPSDLEMRETDVTGTFFETYKIVGEMKWFSEKMVQMHCEKSKNNMQGLILRPGNLYGPFDKFSPEESKVIPALIRRALEREMPFLVWGDGKDVKDFLFIDDFIEAAVKGIALQKTFLILNVSYGSSIELKQVISEVLNATNYFDAIIKFDESKPAMIPKRFISNKMAVELLKWKPNMPLSEGIQKTTAWYENEVQKKGER